MGLLREAGYIYVYSKQILRLNKKLRRLGKEIELHKHRHGKAPEHKKEKHRARHARTMKEINDLMKKHNAVLNRLKTHHQRYAHFLRKEHKI